MAGQREGAGRFAIKYKPAVRSVTAANTSMVVSANVPTGQVLLQNMLESSASAAASPVVTISIPPGDVAVTLQLCAQEAVANYLTAGSYVDVYETAPVNAKANVQRTCDTGHVAVQPGDANTVAVLEDVEVLSVAHALPTSAQSTSSGSSSVAADPIGTALSQNAVAVTFAVKPGQEADTLITIDAGRLRWNCRTLGWASLRPAASPAAGPN